jgi:anti-anti-sigma regulatory factor
MGAARGGSVNSAEGAHARHGLALRRSAAVGYLSGALDRSTLSVLLEGAHRPHPLLVLDLSEVDSVDTAGLRALVGLHVRGCRLVNAPATLLRRVDEVAADRSAFDRSN